MLDQNNWWSFKAVGIDRKIYTQTILILKKKWYSSLQQVESSTHVFHGKFRPGSQRSGTVSEQLRTYSSPDPTKVN